MGAGFQFAFEIVREVLDRVAICGALPNEDGVQEGKLKYDDLVDWITQLKELFDLRTTQDRFGRLQYTCRRSSPGTEGASVCHATITSNGMVLGRGSAALQADAKQRAAQVTVLDFRRRGITREMRPAYAKFCERTPSFPHPE